MLLIVRVNSWQFYLNPKMFYTNAIRNICDKFHVCWVSAGIAPCSVDDGCGCGFWLRSRAWTRICRSICHWRESFSLPAGGHNLIEQTKWRCSLQLKSCHSLWLLYLKIRQFSPLPPFGCCRENMVRSIWGVKPLHLVNFQSLQSDQLHPPSCCSSVPPTHTALPFLLM